MIEFTQEKFSGPLALLLALIESEEMDITEINLAKIADEYVVYVRSLADINPEELADFLVVAAKLLFIKSKALLPYLYADTEEDDSGDLEKQLRMYKEFIEASHKIQTIIEAGNFLFVPPLVKSRRVISETPAFSPPLKVNTTLLNAQFKKILADLAKRVEKKLPEQSLEPKMNIEEKIALIRQMLVDKIKINFSKLLASAANKTEMIVSFLAVLELAKQRELIFDQDELFSEIHITSNK